MNVNILCYQIQNFVSPSHVRLENAIAFINRDRTRSSSDDEGMQLTIWLLINKLTIVVWLYRVNRLSTLRTHPISEMSIMAPEIHNRKCHLSLC